MFGALQTRARARITNNCGVHFNLVHKLSISVSSIGLPRGTERDREREGGHRDG